MGSNPTTAFLIRRRRDAKTYAQRKDRCKVTTEAEIGVIHLKAKEKALPPTPEAGR